MFHRIKKSVCGVQYQCGPLSTSGVCMCAYVKGGVCMFCFACSYKMKCAMSECLCIHLCECVYCVCRVCMCVGVPHLIYHPYSCYSHQGRLVQVLCVQVVPLFLFPLRVFTSSVRMLHCTNHLCCV